MYEHTYGDKSLVFNPATWIVFLLASQNKLLALQWLNSTLCDDKYLIYQPQYLPGIFFFFHSGWLFPDGGIQLLPAFCIWWHQHTFLKLPPSLTHTPSLSQFIAVDKRQGAEQQQQWCSADLSAVGLTHVAGQTKRGSLNREKRRGQVVLSNPPPGWTEVKHCTASSDTDN